MNKCIWIKCSTPKVNSVCSKINTDLILQFVFIAVATLKSRFTFSFQLHLVTRRIQLKINYDLRNIYITTIMCQLCSHSKRKHYFASLLCLTSVMKHVFQELTAIHQDLSILCWKGRSKCKIILGQRVSRDQDNCSKCSPLKPRAFSLALGCRVPGQQQTLARTPIEKFAILFPYILQDKTKQEDGIREKTKNKQQQNKKTTTKKHN